MKKLIKTLFRLCKYPKRKFCIVGIPFKTGITYFDLSKLSKHKTFIVVDDRFNQRYAHSVMLYEKLPQNEI